MYNIKKYEEYKIKHIIDNTIYFLNDKDSISIKLKSIYGNKVDWSSSGNYTGKVKIVIKENMLALEDTSTTFFESAIELFDITSFEGKTSFKDIISLLMEYCFEYEIKRINLPTIKELINSYTWDNIESLFKKLYKEDLKDSYKREKVKKSFKKYKKYILSGYRRTFEYLKEVEPNENKDETRITINHQLWDWMDDNESYDSFDDYFGVSGRKNNNAFFWAMEFTSLKDWAGYYIDNDVLNKYPARFIICHCLWEMTFNGFNEETIKERKEELKERVENCDMSGENDENK